MATATIRKSTALRLVMLFVAAQALLFWAAAAWFGFLFRVEFGWVAAALIGFFALQMVSAGWFFLSGRHDRTPSAGHLVAHVLIVVPPTIALALHVGS